MAVTSSEVARAAGVSQATVSYVLNDTPGQSISASTRARVVKAAQKLGYRPNAAARSLRTGRGAVVLFPLPGPPGYVLSQAIDAASAALAARDLTLVTDVTQYGSVDEQLDAWVRVRPAAVVDLMITHDDPVLPALRKAGVPVLSSESHDEAGWSTSGDVMAIGERRTQLEYLMGKGHRNIAMVVPSQIPVDARVGRAFFREMRNVASSGGASLDVVRVDLVADPVRKVVDTWMGAGLPDAVAAISDDYAIAFVAALVARGIRVPDDIAVMGIDDIPAAAYMTPSLTTIRADFTNLADAIASAVADGATDPLPLAAHEVIARESA